MGTICPPDHRHGETLTCTTSHGCTCDPCMTAHREYSYWRRHMIDAGRADILNSLVDPTGTRRRIQALMCLGWSQVQIAAHAGCTQKVVSEHLYNRWITRSSRDRIATVYELLSARIPATDTTSQRMSVHRTKALARRNGWAPPLAWDDIDNDEHPAIVEPAPYATQIDTVAVDLALKGSRAVNLTPAERRVCVQQLHSRRWSDKAIATLIDCSEKTVGRIRDELHLPAWDDAEQLTTRDDLAA